MHSSVDTAILKAWERTSLAVAQRYLSEFSGLGKETSVLRLLRHEIERSLTGVRITGPYAQERFNLWSIDLVYRYDDAAVAIEGKFKLVSDGAVPDNRKDAFRDLHKLEAYVDSGRYTQGIFLWLTNNPAYLREARGDSHDFSTHQGRAYQAGRLLSATRGRSKSMPPALTLTRNYEFDWQTVVPGENWYALTLTVSPRPTTINEG